MNFSRNSFFMLGIAMSAGLLHATTTFSSAAAFNAATTGDTTVTFTGDSCSGCTTLSDQLIVFSDAGSMLVTTVGGWPDGNVLQEGAPGQTISIAPPTTITAFGLNIVSVVNGGFTFDIKFNDGSSQDFNLSSAANGSAVFFGAVSSNPITSIQFTSVGNNLSKFAIDDVEVGNGISATPEVATTFLIGSGLLAFGFLSRRRRLT